MTRPTLANTTLLLGAGVSVAAGLPTAFALADALIDALIAPQWAREEVQAAMRPPPNDQRPHDQLRFEGLLLWISDIYDDDLTVFSFLDDYTKPCRLHLLCARAGLAGATLVTPNFDDLLERGISTLGGMPCTIDAHAGVSAPHGQIPVLKLHGTRQHHRDGRVEKASAPLQTTLETIAQANVGATMNEVAATALIDTFIDRHVIVAGYSASDDLDIVPTLARTRPASITWLDHAPSSPRPISASRWEPTGGAKQLTSTWRQAGLDVRVILGDTVEAMEQILDSLTGVDSPHTETEKFSGENLDSWRESVRLWAGRVAPREPTGLALAGLCLASIGRSEPSHRAFRQSRGSKDPTSAWSSARRLYELAQSWYFMDDLLQAATTSGRAFREAKAIGDEEMAAYSRLLQGRVAALRGDLTRAERYLSEARALSPTEYASANALVQLGKVGLWRGHTESVEPDLVEGLAILRRLGDYAPMLDAAQTLADLYMRDGRLTEAETLFTECLNLASKLGIRDQLLPAQAMLAEVALLRGKYADATNLIKPVLLQEDFLEVTITWLTASEAALGLGDLGQARTALQQARLGIQPVTAPQRQTIDALEALVDALDGRLGPTLPLQPGTPGWRNLGWSTKVLNLLTATALGDSAAPARLRRQLARPPKSAWSTTRRVQLYLEAVGRFGID